MFLQDCSAYVLKETLEEQGLEQRDQLEVPEIRQVRGVNSLRYGASEHGANLSRCVYHFTFGIYLLCVFVP